MRHGKTGDAVGQGGALGQGNGAPKGLRLGIKGRKGSRRRRGFLAAAAPKKPQEKAEGGEAAHLFDHQCIIAEIFEGRLGDFAATIRLQPLVGVKMDTMDANMDPYPKSATKKGQALEA
jgi:hypothetical protein